MYLIQGFMFMKRLVTHIAYDDDGGAFAATSPAVVQAMFAGVFVNHGSPGGLVGRMTDRYGESSLSQIVVERNRLAFVKRYDGQYDNIQYTFSRAGKEWAGTFEGSAVWSGQARCVLTRVEDNFMSPPMRGR